MNIQDREICREKTIRDFGVQWTAYPENEGIYASLETLQDICGPYFDITSFKNRVIIDVGSGSGRIVNMLIAAGAEHVIAVEPSQSFRIMMDNTNQHKNKITYLNIRGDELSVKDVDYVISLGVIHHISDPEDTMIAIYNSLKKGGKAIIWLYGKEGNKLYLFFLYPLRCISQYMSHKMLHYFSKFLNFLLWLYIKACKYCKLPMYKYMNNVLSKWTPHTRFITIYDQLNPSYTKYYTRDEAVNLLNRVGFKDIKVYHRHGYSWTVIGKKI